MPHEVSFDLLPLGHAVEACKGGGSVKICPSAFLSTEDGQAFVRQLEDFPSQLLGKLPQNARVAPSQVDHLLAVIRRDRTATVYVNELGITLGVLIGRSMKAGEPVFKNDIVDIATAEFKGVSIPDDTGVLLVFSVG